MTGSRNDLTAKYTKYTKKDGKGRWIATLTLAMTFKGKALIGQYKPQGYVFASHVSGVANQFLDYSLLILMNNS